MQPKAAPNQSSYLSSFIQHRPAHGKQHTRSSQYASGSCAWLSSPARISPPNSASSKNFLPIQNRRCYHACIPSNQSTGGLCETFPCSQREEQRGFAPGRSGDCSHAAWRSDAGRKRQPQHKCSPRHKRPSHRNPRLRQHRRNPVFSASGARRSRQGRSRFRSCRTVNTIRRE